MNRSWANFAHTGDPNGPDLPGRRRFDHASPHPFVHSLAPGTGGIRGVTKNGKTLSDFDVLNKGAEAMLEELAWWTYTLRAGRATSTAAAA